MSTTADGTSSSPLLYCLRFRGQMGAAWLANLSNATLSTARHGRSTETTIVGEVPDEAALIGLVNLVHDLGGALISVESRVKPPAAEPVTNHAS
ncbi:MAG: hypothetical protein ACRC1H_16210 [Caldilineaceae bacterium]